MATAAPGPAGRTLCSPKEWNASSCRQTPRTGPQRLRMTRCTKRQDAAGLSASWQQHL